MEDYYRILGVDRSASADELRRAYRRQANNWHPDRSGGDADRFREIREAYNVLSDRAACDRYERFRSAQRADANSYDKQRYKPAQKPFPYWGAVAISFGAGLAAFLVSGFDLIAFAGGAVLCWLFYMIKYDV